MDEATGEPLPGVVQARDAAGKLIPFEELVNRGQGIEEPGPIHDWWILPKVTTVMVPARLLKLTAFSGLETELATLDLDLRDRREASPKIALKRFADARRARLLAGNTHLHLKKLSKQQADRYLSEVPLGDGLDVVFLSYLERAGSDLDYTSNKYSHEDLHRLSHNHLHLGYGEELRHNFDAYGEGYGHILLLDIPIIIRPVSIGPGLTEAKFDAPPLQAGIEQARDAKGKVIWAHNRYGFEDIPNWITGRIHANNIYDGSERGSYRDTYYRYLNIGLHVPFSTGTDWFIYDLSRVYVETDPARPVTPTEWLERLAAGKTYITNGPLLEFTVDGQPIGSTIELAKSGALSVRARAVGRSDFKRIELVHNGQVVERADSRRDKGHFVADMELRLPINASAWLALRTPPRPVAGDPELQEPVPSNEFGGGIFAHTSPVYVNVGGDAVFDAATAEGLLDEMRSDMREIDEHATFANNAERQRVMHVYEEAIGVLAERLEKAPSREESPSP
ncbi:MAG TPA: CehA/McbA family metallohydrolase [Pirellulales bacterium]|nr:CehA/McbA family metallohydrolase [Pirellulales bacterium]